MLCVGIGVDGGALSIEDMVCSLLDFPHEPVAPAHIVATVPAKIKTSDVSWALTAKESET